MHCVCSPLLRGSISYAGLFLGGYKETGAELTPLSVKERNLSLIKTRGEVSLPWKGASPYIGAFGRYQVGGDAVHTTLAGQDLTFQQPISKNIAALLLGVRTTKSFRCGQIFVDLEASFDSDHSTRILAHAAFNTAF